MLSKKQGISITKPRPPFSTTNTSSSMGSAVRYACSLTSPKS